MEGRIEVLESGRPEEPRQVHVGEINGRGAPRWLSLDGSCCDRESVA